MHVRASQRLTVVVVATLTAAATTALTRADSSVAVRVDYSAAPTCPDALVFGEELRARARVRFVGERDATSALTVRIRRVGKRFEGQLLVREAGQGETERKVAGDSCGEVVSGLALVSALALGFTPTPDPPDAQPVIEPDSAPPPAPAPVATADARPPEVHADAQAPTPTTTPATPSPYSVALGADAELLSDIAPNLALAVPLYVEVARATGDRWALASRLRFARASGTTGFTWTTAGLDLCPLVWKARALRLEACGRAQVGALEAFGVGVVPSRDTMRPWLSVGPLLAARADVWGPAYLRIAAGLDVPLVRDRFFVQPNETVFNAPAAGWSVSLGAGATIY